MNLSELMLKIRETPEAFLQDDRIFQLRAFVRGFILAKNTSSQAITEDHNLLESVDSMIKNQYGIYKTEQVPIEELLFDHEGKKAFQKYLELWFKYS
jgi:hypothetical protein